MLNKRNFIRLIIGLLATAFILRGGLPTQAATSELFFSEYIEGSSFNKAVEIYNGTGASIDLSAYTIELYSNGSGSVSQSVALSGILADGDVFVAAHPSADPAILAVTDLTSSTVINFNGNDAVVLRKSGTVVDSFGQVGVDPGSQWPGGGQDDTLRRAETVCAGDTNPTDVFDASLEWVVFPNNTFDGLGTHTTNCGGTTSGQPLPLTENFDDCTLAGWQIVSVDADTDHTWTCSASFSNIEANGFGDTAPANDWLITPALNLDAQAGDTLTFRNHTSFTDINYPQLHVLYSTDYDGGGDPTTATWTELTGITFSAEDSSLFVDSGDVDLSGISGTNVYVAFQYVSSGTGSGTAARWRLDAISFFEKAAPSGWVINEINADPDAVNGDANGDGVVDTSQDEFVEIFNSTGGDVDMSGWTLSDAVGVRHIFPSGTVVPGDCAIVVFGGGTPAGSFGQSLVQTASTGLVGLNNGGDTVTLFDGVGNVASTSYGGEGGDNQSLTRDPDITGTDPLVKHTTATGSGGALFSPGTMVDGSQFAGCTSPERKIHEVQGGGLASPLVGQTVIIEGIVVGDFQDGASGTNGDLNGFHVQEEDADADADPLTSEGIFVFDGNSPGVNVQIGDLVQVQGTVSEFNGLTEITSFSGVTIISSGNTLPAKTNLSLPVTTVNDFEAYEGMLVTFPQALYISEYFNFDRFNETVLTSKRHHTPTAEVEPGPDAIQAAQEFLLDKITLDDGRTNQNPDPAIHPNGAVFNLDNLFRGGDTVQGVTGIMDYSFDLYRIQPTEGADYNNSNPRTAQPDAVGGNLKVSSFNVLNYFTTLDYPTGDPLDNKCGPLQNQECRGADADQPLEFTRQRDKIIAALTAINADVVGLIEIENHPGDVPTADLVSGLNDALGAGTYDYIATGAIGSDAIRVALIYKPGSVTPVGSYAVLDSSVDTRFDDGKNRPALAQTFIQNTDGGIVTVVVNHLKSKGSDCNDVGDPDTGDGSGNCNQTRKAAAEALVDWLATDPTGSGDADVLIIGDLNSYDKEDPIDAILAGADDASGTDDDYTDLLFKFMGEFAYSYVFDGQLGYLDHGLANQALVSEVSGTTVWHINADEPDLIDYDTSFKGPNQDAIYAPDPYRSSDHDPVIVGLNVCDEIAPTLAVTVSPASLWPPNHKYVTVSAMPTASDNFDPNPMVSLVSVTSNEPDSGLNSEDVPNDIVITSDTTFKLRAERADDGAGRIYTITYQATDACGNSIQASATVTVPHDQGGGNRQNSASPSDTSQPVNAPTAEPTAEPRTEPTAEPTAESENRSN